MVRAETAPRARRLRYTLWAFTVHGNGTVGEMAGATEVGGLYRFLCIVFLIFLAIL